MKYKKPIVFDPQVVRGAVCGGGSPCGRPCSSKA